MSNKTESSTQLEFVNADGWSISAFWFLDLVCALPEAIRQEKIRRIENKIAWKRWEKDAISLACELTCEPDYADVILKDSLSHFLQNLK